MTVEQSVAKVRDLGPHRRRPSGCNLGLLLRGLTGEFLWATPTVTQNVISDIDGATGAVTENGEVVFSALGQEGAGLSTLIGGKDW